MPKLIAHAMPRWKHVSSGSGFESLCAKYTVNWARLLAHLNRAKILQNYISEQPERIVAIAVGANASERLFAHAFPSNSAALRLLSPARPQNFLHIPNTLRPLSHEPHHEIFHRRRSRQRSENSAQMISRWSRGQASLTAEAQRTRLFCSAESQLLCLPPLRRDLSLSPYLLSSTPDAVRPSLPRSLPRSVSRLTPEAYVGIIYLVNTKHALARHCIIIYLPTL